MQSPTVLDLIREAINYVMTQELEKPRFITMEIALIHEYFAKQQNGYMSMTQARWRELTGLSAPTVRDFTNKMVESGRWEIHVGSGYAPTTYRMLFANELPSASKKGN
jgi:hypothetical protein